MTVINDIERKAFETWFIQNFCGGDIHHNEYLLEFLPNNTYENDEVDGMYDAFVAGRASMPSIPDGYVAAVNNLIFMAETSGGTAGRDEGICSAISEVLRLAPQPASIPDGYVHVDEVKQLCRDFSSRSNNVYIKDVEAALDGLAAQPVTEK